jgi:hypothetical protein
MRSDLKKHVIKPPRYVLRCAGTIAELEFTVNMHLENGYMLNGSVFVLPNGYLCQPMVLINA